MVLIVYIHVQKFLFTLLNLAFVYARFPVASADSVVVLSQPDELVTMTTAGHAYGEDVVTLL